MEESARVCTVSPQLSCVVLYGNEPFIFCIDKLRESEEIPHTTYSQEDIGNKHGPGSAGHAEWPHACMHFAREPVSPQCDPQSRSKCLQLGCHCCIWDDPRRMRH